MSHRPRTDFDPGDRAVVIWIDGITPNRVRSCPRKGNQYKKGKILEGEALTILKSPPWWSRDYPYDDNRRMWYYVRGDNGIEGWSAANEDNDVFLARIVPEPDKVCQRTFG